MIIGVIGCIVSLLIKDTPRQKKVVQSESNQEAYFLFEDEGDFSTSKMDASIVQQPTKKPTSNEIERPANSYMTPDWQRPSSSSTNRSQGKNFCSNCGHPLRIGGRFCQNCGHNIE